jgi:hypothetical protein
MFTSSKLFLSDFLFNIYVNYIQFINNLVDNISIRAYDIYKLKKTLILSSEQYHT